MELANLSRSHLISLMVVKAVVQGKVRAFRLSPVLERLHRKNAGKTMTEAEAIAFVESKRRERAVRFAKSYLASGS